MGRKHRPFYRVVVAEAQTARNGPHVDILGHYDPLANPSIVVIDVERAKDWLRKGAQPTDRVKKLLEIAGLQR